MNEIIVSKLQELAWLPDFKDSMELLESNEVQAIKDDFYVMYRDTARIPPGVMTDQQIIQFVAQLHKFVLRYLNPKFTYRVTPVKVYQELDTFEAYKFRVEWQKAD